MEPSYKIVLSVGLTIVLVGFVSILYIFQSLNKLYFKKLFEDLSM